MNIVFYTPVNFVCRDVISLLKKFKDDGHQVMLLSQVPKGAMHEELEMMAIPTFVHVVKKGKFKFAGQLFRLVRFCKDVKADVLFSHLEPTNFVSVLAQFLIQTRVVIFRHHLDLAQLSQFGQSWSYRVTYKLARNVVSVSARSRRYMIDVENIDGGKIHHINLGYNFSLYRTIPIAAANALRSTYQADILLLTVGRLDQFKRPEISLRALKILRHELNVDAKLVFLGDGELLENLKRLAQESDLSDYVFFPGFISNILTYMAAADFLIHPSISESSSVVVKEAALVNLPVVVCDNVGDFNEYIIHEQNGFICDSNTMAEESASLVAKYAGDPQGLKKIATRLKNEVLHRFNIHNTYPHYKIFLKQ